MINTNVWNQIREYIIPDDVAEAAHIIALTGDGMVQVKQSWADGIGKDLVKSMNTSDVFGLWTDMGYPESPEPSCYPETAMIFAIKGWLRDNVNDVIGRAISEFAYEVQLNSTWGTDNLGALTPGRTVVKCGERLFSLNYSLYGHVDPEDCTLAEDSDGELTYTVADVAFQGFDEGSVWVSDPDRYTRYSAWLADAEDGAYQVYLITDDEGRETLVFNLIEAI